MKITKTKLMEIIKQEADQFLLSEETFSDEIGQALLKSINELISGFTGESPTSIGLGQAMLGKGYRPKQRVNQQDVRETLEKMIQEELEGLSGVDPKFYAWTGQLIGHLNALGVYVREDELPDTHNYYDEYLDGKLAKEIAIEVAEDLGEELREVYSDKQRRYMCAMKDATADERPEGLSKAEAEEMCKGPMKEPKGEK